MLKKMMSRLGFRSATVDLVLDHDVVEMGGTASGRIEMTAENKEEINSLAVELLVESQYKKDDHVHTFTQSLGKVRLCDAFVMEPGQRYEMPFSVTIPEYLPVSSVTTHYYFKTHLDVAGGIDARDRDAVDVLPSGLLRNFLEGFELLGCQHRYEGFDGRYQIIDFQPTTWMRGKLDELVFTFLPGRSQNEIIGFFEIDKKTGGLGGWLADEMDLDEKKGRFTFSRNQLSTPERAAQTIREFVEHHYSYLQG